MKTQSQKKKVRKTPEINENSIGAQVAKNLTIVGS